MPEYLFQLAKIVNSLSGCKNHLHIRSEFLILYTMTWTRILMPLICTLALCQGVSSCRFFHRAQDPVPQRDTVYPLGFCTDSFAVSSGEILSGEIFSAWMTRAGLDAGASVQLAQAADSVFDVRRLRAGNHWDAYSDSLSGELRYVVYEEDRIAHTVFRCTEPYGAWRVLRQVDTLSGYADVTIQSSLWNDMTQAGAPVLLILRLSEIYAWTIDFFALQKEDRFRVLYDYLSCEGDLIDIGAVYYAEFEHDGNMYPAIRLDRGDGGNVYWNAEGESLRKAFLKAPLQFTRISSGFSYHRRHPVHGDVRAHTGVDYAAPTGTPVMTIGDGTVLSAGWGGGGGKTVKIRHNAVYTTAYLHLSRYAAGIQAGARVKQGQVIGYVGATGTATGPHLDFRVWENGRPVNPLTMSSPPADPVGAAYLPALDSLRLLYKSRMDSLSVIHGENPGVH